MQKQRFFFDLVRDAEIIRDEDGVLIVDLAEAKRQAEATISELRERGEFDAESSSWHLSIRDEHGDVLAAVLIG